MSAAIMCQTLPLHAASGGMDERDASGEAVKILPCDALYTVEGIDPLWPKTVQVEVGGKTEERRVKWEFQRRFFHGGQEHKGVSDRRRCGRDI